MSHGEVIKQHAKEEGAPAVLRELLIHRHRRPVSLVIPMEACQTGATLSAIVSH